MAAPAAHAEVPGDQPHVVTIHYSRAQGVLLAGNTRPVKDILRAFGLEWRGERVKLEGRPAWFMRGTRGKAVNGFLVERLESLMQNLREAGWRLRVEIEG